MPAGPLTIYNNLSVSDVIYDASGNSINWNNTHSTVTANSGNWQSTYTTMTANSGNWQSTYSTVSSLSVAWDETINIKSYGAKGDGVTDDTAAIQAAITNNPYKIIYFPSGNYFISSTITIDNPVQLRGNRAWNGSRITWTSQTLSAFRVTSAGGIIVDGLYFAGASNSTSGYTINLEGAGSLHNRGSKIINCHFVNGFTCIHTVSAATFNIDRVSFSNYSNTGVVVQNLHDADSGDSSITNSVFTTNSLTAIGILQYSSGGLRINNNKILSGKHGYKMEYSGELTTGDLLFCNNSVENQNDTSIHITNKSLIGKFHNFCIIGNQFANMPKVIALSGNRADCFYRGVIASNTIRTNGTAPHEGIRLQNVSYINVVGNTIETPLGTGIIFEPGCVNCTYSDNNIPNSSIQISNSSNSIGSTANFSTSTTTYNNSVSATNLYARTSILSSGTDLLNILAPISLYGNLTGNWQSTYTTMTANSGNWQSTYTTMTANSGNWNSVYSTVYTLSNLWEESADIIPTVTNYLSTNNVLISSATVTSDLQVNNNVLIYGNISARGTSTFANTIFTTTTAISVVHVGSGTAMWVGNDGVGNIATFYDIDQGIEILHVGGENSLAGAGVGIRTSYPNKTLTVNGEISANSIIYDVAGNSINWNSVYTTTNANSAYWNLGYDGYTVLNSNSATWSSTYNTVQSNSATTWNYQGSDIKALTADWVGGNIAYTNLIANSAAYLSGVDLSFLSVSANWNNVYTSVASTSANWNNVYSTVAANSATYITTTPTTAPGLSAITKIVAVSALPATQVAGTLYIVM